MSDTIDIIDNVVAMPTPMHVIAKEITELYDRVDANRADWIETTLALAAKLKEARERFPNNHAFSHWLVDEDLIDRINAPDRAALINMAGDPALARFVMQESGSRSWRLVWEEMRSFRSKMIQNASAEIPRRLNSVVKTDHFPNESPEIPEDSAIAPTKKVAQRKLSSRSGFFGRPRAEEVQALYNKPTRLVIAKAIRNASSTNEAKEIWGMILTAIDHGLVVENNIVPQELTLRVLFPQGLRGFCMRFNLTDRADRRQVREVILPAMIANRDELLANPQRLEEIVKTYRRAQNAPRMIAAAPAASGPKHLPDAESEVTMYGRQYWPKPDPTSSAYDFMSLQFAVAAFKDWESWLLHGDPSPVGRAIMVRNMTKWVGFYCVGAARETEQKLYEARRRIAELEGSAAPPQNEVLASTKIRRLFELIRNLASDLERDPTGRCVYPNAPLIVE
jgi:hypothetical protein